MDDADLTALREERMAELLRRNRPAPAMLPPTGECLNCGEPLGGERRFCDAACRDDHSARERALRLGGRAD